MMTPDTTADATVTETKLDAMATAADKKLNVTKGAVAGSLHSRVNELLGKAVESLGGVTHGAFKRDGARVGK